MSLYEIKHDNRIKSGKNHNKNPIRAQKRLSPGVQPVINETLKPQSRAAYTIPNLFYPPQRGMSSTNAQKYQRFSAPFVDRNKILTEKPSKCQFRPTANPTLTTPARHARINERYAGMVELGSDASAAGGG